MSKQAKSYLWLVIGSFLLTFFGWRWNVPLAAWLAPVFLIRFFRSQEKWPTTLIAVPVMTVPLFVSLTGGWDFTFVEEIGVSLFRAMPFLVALYADRFFVRRSKPAVASLVYPATYLMIDFLVGLTPIATSFSASVTQFSVTPFIQMASVTGIWGIDFVIGWFASIANLVWEHDFNLAQMRAQKTAAPVIVFVACLSAILILGGLRLSAAEPQSDTVKVAAIIVEHERDYFEAVVDLGTPEDEAHKYEAEIAELEERLFAESERAAQFGAEIMFWSELNGVIYPEEKEAFIARAQAFAEEYQVYFSPAFIVFRYGDMTTDNQLVMITPEGEVAYTYTKTKSWYPTDSDGIIHAVETPYGTLSSAICFDMDFPAFINQVAKKNVDIMLVPSFDWEPIKPYHTYVGLFRAVENGFSMIRQVNEGTSIAVDYQGNVIAYQDFFDTSDPIMIADIPTQGVKTIYGVLGDWFVYLNILFVVSLVGWVIIRSFTDGGRPD